MSTLDCGFDALSEAEAALSHAIWTGFIPLELHLDPRDNATGRCLESVFIRGSRSGYLPHSAATAIQYFRSFAVDCLEGDPQREAWFSYGAADADANASDTATHTHSLPLPLPLRAHVPLGVLIDSLSFSNFWPLPLSLPLPLPLTVHLSSFPSEDRLSCGYLPALRSIFCHSLKQALFLLHGHTRAYSELLPTQQEQLWTGACAGDEGAYEAAAKTLRPGCDLQAGAISGRRHRLPVRVIINRLDDVGAGGGGGAAAVSRGMDLTSLSLYEAVISAVPADCRHLFHRDDPEARRRVLVQGVSLPLASPLQRVWRLFHSADLFLYINVLLPSLVPASVPTGAEGAQTAAGSGFAAAQRA